MVLVVLDHVGNAQKFQICRKLAVFECFEALILTWHGIWDAILDAALNPWSGETPLGSNIMPLTNQSRSTVRADNRPRELGRGKDWDVPRSQFAATSQSGSPNANAENRAWSND